MQRAEIKQVYLGTCWGNENNIGTQIKARTYGPSVTNGIRRKPKAALNAARLFSTQRTMMSTASSGEWITVEEYDVLTYQAVELYWKLRKEIVRKIKPF